MTVDFTLPTALEAHEPPEARGRTRDGVRLLVSRRATGEIAHHEFRELPDLLDPGDLLVVNTSATLPAAVRLDRISVHFSTPVPGADDRLWIVELRRNTGKTSKPYTGGCAGEWIPLPGGATLTLVGRHGGGPGECGRSSPHGGSERLWEARLSTDVVPYLRRHGAPIRYGYVRRDWPTTAYQTVFARDRSTGSAEMPSAGRPFTPELVTRLVSRGVLMAPITLHTGVASPEAHEPPYAERYEVPEATAALVEHVRSRGGRVIAVGTTAVRALETAVDASGHVRPSTGWTEHVVTPDHGVRAVNGLLTGLHEPKSSHLMMLTAIAGPDLLTATYDAALAEGYLWHEFGDINLVLG
ncbi:S-adenosylmethionine--tRNA ribosyltransferase-isomerase [Actinomadura pelletieri DSM 43383]|uniref:S-adenosylmethionine--tRNA ribosyltransferase-isomerase n=1 Tax=Actinomadura pelletieri DSM 43383 TaxID=1120940 RepID=A0A495QY82_9ACTN|nr:S-adenosylmethionine:tRNA ribosyltransferase-isomerase [Actinomadura pelletieri]RKS79151.1 S-adenosylmethionine--tRNA ribosyltransferase-isomerase [Actinomadura pelletieri DSM 43383]